MCSSALAISTTAIPLSGPPCAARLRQAVSASPWRPSRRSVRARSATILSRSRRPPGPLQVRARGETARAVRPGRKGSVEASERLVVAACPPEQPSEADEVAARCAAAPVGVGQVPIEVVEQAGQRAYVELVVADDVHEPGRAAAADEVEVPAGDLPPLDVAVPLDGEEMLLGRLEAGIRHPVTEQPSDQWQQVEVPAQRGGGRRSIR